MQPCPRCKRFLALGVLKCTDCGAPMSETSEQRQQEFDSIVRENRGWRWYHVLPLLILVGSIEATLKHGFHRFHQRARSTVPSDEPRKAGDLRRISSRPPQPVLPGPKKPVQAVPPGKYAAVKERSMILQILITLAKEQLGVRDDKVTADTFIGIGGLEADELDHVELIMSAEEAFNVEIADDLASTVKTMGDLTSAVMQMQHVRSSASKSLGVDKQVKVQVER